MRPGRAARVEAPAKVNLLLRVLARREDGFHDIETVFQAIELSDTVEVTLIEVPPGRSGAVVELEVLGADLGPEEDNLAWRAASLVLEAADVDLGARVRLHKRIPAGAGLGGGSSDGAAVLRALDRLLDHPISREFLRRLGARLGSDVPFFLDGPLAMGRGRGERVEPLPALPPADLVIVMPPVHVATGPAYQALSDWRSKRGDWGSRGSSLHAPRDWTAVAALASNDFEQVVPGAFPEVAASLDALRGLGAVPALLSGSGGACFGVFPDAASAERAARELSERLGWPALATRTLDRVARVEVVEGP